MRLLPDMSNVSCGEQHCIALDRAGVCWSFGLGVFGQLGLGDCSDRLRPAKLLRFECAGGERREIDGIVQVIFSVCLSVCVNVNCVSV